MKALSIVAGLIGVVLLAVPASAFTYNEATDGDLPAGNLLLLDPGINHIIGQGSFVPAVDPFGDFDDFAFGVPAGYTLQSVTYAFATTLLPNTTQLIAGFSLVHDKTTLSEVQVDLLGGSPIALFADVLPVNAATYRFSDDLLQTTKGGGGSWDYDITLNVAPAAVPEPTALSLLLAGLLAGWHLRRRTAAR